MVLIFYGSYILSIDPQAHGSSPVSFKQADASTLRQEAPGSPEGFVATLSDQETRRELIGRLKRDADEASAEKVQFQPSLGREIADMASRVHGRLTQTVTTLPTLPVKCIRPV